MTACLTQDIGMPNTATKRKALGKALSRELSLQHRSRDGQTKGNLVTPQNATVGALLHPDPVTHPPHDPNPTPSPAALEPRPDTVAQAAATGLMTHVDVDTAVVNIDGPRHAPSLEIDCLLNDDADVLRSTELIVRVRDQIESMLDVTFDTAEMTVRNAA
jgi:hypothetical protein